MSLWSNSDANTSAPKYDVAAGYGVSANGFTMYNNTAVSAFITGEAAGIFGVDPAETANTTAEGPYVTHAGWNLRHAGTGPVINITLDTAGANYSTPGFIVFTGGGGSGANASYTVNSVSNTITTVTLNSGGSGYVTAPTATAANGTGVNSASFTVTTGGRSNRINYETLVAFGSMTGDGSDDTQLPE
jgi:hypothetical protein